MESGSQEQNTTRTQPESDTPNPNDILKPLRTYERDIAEMVRSHQASAVQINVAQKKKEEVLPEAERKEIQKARQEERKELLKKTERVAQTSILTILSIVLVVAGLLVFVLFFMLRDTNKPTHTVVDTSTQKPFVPSDSVQNIFISNATREDILFQIKKILESPLPNNSVTHVQFLMQTITGNEDATPATFFGIVAPYIPASLTRAFDNTFFAGIYTQDIKQPFFIISIDAFDKAFEGMLAWEKNMYSDINNFLASHNQSDTASTSPARNTFEDVIVLNKDTRMLRNENGDTLLLYSFINERTLFIVHNETVFKEILSRYTSGSLVR